MKLEELQRLIVVFSGWNAREINIAWQMLLFLRKVDLTIDKFEEYAEFRQVQTQHEVDYTGRMFYLRSKFFKEDARTCDECGNKMLLQPVNVSDCTRVGNRRLNSVWTCDDRKGCGHQVWNSKSASFYINRTQKKFDEKYKVAKKL